MAALKERVRAKQLTFGSWLSFSDLQITEMMARSGFDWLVVDMEHTSTTTSEMRAMIQVIDLAGVVPMVRVGANDPLLIKRALDAGARGIVVPMVCSAEDARAAADAVYYPPIGNRGVGLARAQGFGTGFDTYKSRQTDDLILIVQIEHHRAIEALDEILAVAGVDAFLIGPYDLSGSLGAPGDFGNAEVVAALEKASAVARDGEKPGGVHVVHSDSKALERVIGQGYRLIAYGTEMIFLSEKLGETRSVLDRVRAGTPAS